MLLALKAICRSEDGRTSSGSVERGAVAGIAGASRLGSRGRSGPGSCDSAVAQWLDERADRARLRGDAGWRAALAQLVLAIGVDGLRASDRPGREAVKSEAAARVVASLLTLSTADRPNWTLPRLQAEIARQGEDTIFEVAARQDVKKMASDGVGSAMALPGGKTWTPSTAPGCGSSSCSSRPRPATSCCCHRPSLRC